ncbi:MAG TPA: Na+/H+ antiporter NhaA [Xanthomonadales bacterium]|nr:Na+/H+ antiporter NhaA [Xanthomonadales bacterium]
MNSQVGKLDRPVSPSQDHISGPHQALMQLVEYGDYECPHCRRAHGVIRQMQDRFGDEFSYTFRHLPNVKLHPNARLAAEAAEAAGAQGKFWEMHDAMFESPGALSLDCLTSLARGLDLDVEQFTADLESGAYADRVQQDLDSAVRSNSQGTPTFYVNGRRYDGAWDTDALVEALQPRLGFKMKSLSQDFAGLPAAGGLVLLLSALVAMIWANSPWAQGYMDFWETELVLGVGHWELSHTFQEWINEGLMALFFFIVGLEVKRELTVGELSTPREAALPITAAVGGLAVPALLYLLFNSGSEVAHGWGIPISTDTAFTLGLLALLGPRIPYSLKIFVAALAIADDVGAILVISVFYSTDLNLLALAITVGLFLLALALNRARVYRPLPYAVIGIGLWLAVLYTGVHATLAGVLLAMVIPTRSPPTTGGLLDQTIAAFNSLEAPLHEQQADEARYQNVVRTLETVTDRLLSPAQRLERNLQPWSTYFVLPLLALANAGIPINAGDLDLLNPLSLGIILGLVVGKPLGIALATWLVVRVGIAHLPDGISWRILTGAACLCGIGFTMSIFIANAAFSDTATLQLAKLSIIVASVMAAILGWLLLREKRQRKVASAVQGPA